MHVARATQSHGGDRRSQSRAFAVCCVLPVAYLLVTTLDAASRAFAVVVLDAGSGVCCSTRRCSASARPSLRPRSARRSDCVLARVPTSPARRWCACLLACPFCCRPTSSRSRGPISGAVRGSWPLLPDATCSRHGPTACRPRCSFWASCCIRSRCWRPKWRCGASTAASRKPASIVAPPGRVLRAHHAAARRPERHRRRPDHLRSGGIRVRRSRAAASPRVHDRGVHRLCGALRLLAAPLLLAMPLLRAVPGRRRSRRRAARRSTRHDTSVPCAVSPVVFHAFAGRHRGRCSRHRRRRWRSPCWFWFARRWRPVRSPPRRGLDRGDREQPAARRSLGATACRPWRVAWLCAGARRPSRAARCTGRAGGPVRRSEHDRRCRPDRPLEPAGAARRASTAPTPCSCLRIWRDSSPSRR